MNHDEIQESLEAYVLGALDEPDRGLVAEHVASCEACRAAVADLERVAAQLPAALAMASPVAPSDVVAGRLRRALRGRRRRPARAVTAVAAAAVILLAVAAAWIWRSQRTLADERRRSDRLTEQLALFLEVVDSSDRDRVVLRATSEDDDWYGKVFTHPEMPFVLVMANRLPPADGSEYHVRLTFADGSTVLAGTLSPNDEGFGSLVYSYGADGPVVTGATITRDPAGGEPDGVVVLSADADSAS